MSKGRFFAPALQDSAAPADGIAGHSSSATQRIVWDSAHTLPQFVSMSAASASDAAEILERLPAFGQAPTATPEMSSSRHFIVSRRIAPASFDADFPILPAHVTSTLDGSP